MGKARYSDIFCGDELNGVGCNMSSRVTRSTDKPYTNLNLPLIHWLFVYNK